MLEDFKEFTMRGNVIDLAVGVIIGAAFGSIVRSLVSDIIMPHHRCGHRRPRLFNYFVPLSAEGQAYSLAEAKKQGAVLAWGSFLTIVINFLIIAFVLFLAIKGLSILQRQEAAKPVEPPKPSREAELLTEIRDLLKKA